MSVEGGSGADTLDLSTDSAGVSIDINTGTATYAGTISGIENVITGAGDDTLIGALAGVLLDTGSGTDTLDLSAVTADLTITIHITGTVSVTDGVDTINKIANVENIVGGSGTNTYVFEDGASLAGTITGSAILDYSAYTTAS